VRTREQTVGLLLGFAGMAVFSLTLPATRAAVAQLDPFFVGFGRAAIAGLAAAAVLAVTRPPRPSRRHFSGLALVVLGVVFGFPLLVTWAMQYADASHGAVVIGVLPLASTAAAVIRDRERPSPGFWAAAIAGAVLVVAFVLKSGAGTFHPADLALVAAVVLASFGYAEGARLTREFGGWQTISWALLAALPLSLPLFGLEVWRHGAAALGAGPVAWSGFLYVVLASQYFGFFPWYRGLARGGISYVSQVLLLQPFFTIVAAGILLGESITPSTVIFALAVVATVAISWRMPVARSGPAV
jgi:drug/metabolite transporter (DMT)-like permease